MKVMIDITSLELKAAAQIGHTIDHETLKGLCQKILESYNSWSDPSVSEISYYAPGDEESVSLSKQLIFDPHTAMQVEQPGMYLAFPHQKMVTHRFEIGKDHSGMIIMTYESWKALGMVPSTQDQKQGA